MTAVSAGWPLRLIAVEDIEQSICARFEQQADLHADRVAVKFGGEMLNYVQLDRRANRIAHAVLDSRAPRGSPVVVLLDQGIALIAAILGVLKAGSLYVALDPAQPALVDAVLADCGARLVLADERGLRALTPDERADLDVLRVDRIGPGSDDSRPKQPVGPDSLAYIYYTSGTTGQPKGVFDNHRNVLHNVMRYTNNLRITHDDGLTLVQAPSFSGAISSMFCALLNGATLFPFDLRRDGIEALTCSLAQEPITIYHSVPAIFERVAESGLRFERLRVIRLEGDRSTPRHVELFRRHFGPGCVLVNGLGATETGIVCQQFIDHATAIEGPVVPVGHATQGMEVVLIDDEGREVGQGEVGEIAVRSQYLARGYWGRTDLSEQAFSVCASEPGTRQYRTRDLGRFAAGGALEHLGRKDQRARVNGAWVDLDAIEAQLLASGLVRQAVVDTRTDEVGRVRLVAYLVPMNGDAQSQRGSELRAHLRAAGFAGASIPRAFVTLAALPLDANGKVARQRLPAPKPATTNAQTYFAPRAPTEKRVAEIFAQVLRVPRVGLRDDFFELGGDSLDATELGMRLERDFGRPWPLASFDQHATVAAITGIIERDPSVQTVVPLGSGMGQRPFFLVHAHMGHVFGFDALARLLDPVCALHGLQARGWHRSEDRIRSIPELAARYLAEIRRVQPSGPYALGGVCFGNVVAVEIARQLQCAGESVDRLALIDVASVQPDVRFADRPLATVAAHLRALRDLNGAARARYLLERVRWRIERCRRDLEWVLWRICAANGWPLPRGLRHRHRMIEMIQRGYAPDPCDGPAALFAGGEAGTVVRALAHVRDLVRGEIELHALPVDGREIIGDAGVESLAEALSSYLAPTCGDGRYASALEHHHTEAHQAPADWRRSGAP